MHGVTDVMPALYYNMNADQYVKAIELLKKTMAEGKAKNIIGFYMEGPYLNPNYGCNRENNPWKDPVNKANYQKVVDAAGELALVWCVAPERENIEEFVQYAKSKNPKAVFSVAHSEASPEQIEALMPYGLKLATHHTNATGVLHKYPECRSACVDEVAQYNDTIYTELICDKMGIHVEPYILRLVKKIKGDDRIILISDSTDTDGPIPEKGDYSGADDLNFDFEGEISGTRFSLDRACRNMMIHTGASLCQVFKYASRNPARAIGLYDRGEIREGNIANLTLVDAEFNVKAVFLHGDMIVNNIL